MARQARQKSQTGMYNVIMRGNGELFRDDDDYNHFLELSEKYIHKIYGFSLMKNAVCMALKESEKGISYDLKPLTTSYARYFNKKYETEGKLFYGRFRSEPIESDEQLENSAVLSSKIAEILGVEGYAHETDGEYEMISFYMSLPGMKRTLGAKKMAEKAVEEKELQAKKPVKNEKEKLDKPEVEVKESKIEEMQKKKKKSSLPSWLL